MSEAENDQSDGPKQVSGTGTPAEDREEERGDRLWDLKEEAKWGRDTETQKKAIDELRKNGTSALGYLEEILAVVSVGEIKQYCQSAIDSIAKDQPADRRKEESS